MLSERELAARVDINWERYVKVQNIEASCALDIARTMILPAAVRYLGELSAVGAVVARHRRRSASGSSGLADSLVDAIDGLEHAQHEAHEAGSVQDEARGVRRRRHPGAGRRCARSPTSSRRSSPTTSGRCRSTASCSSSTDGRSPGDPGGLSGRAAGGRRRARRPRFRHYVDAKRDERDETERL